MKLLDVIKACHGRVAGGDPFLWKCYGDNAQFMEFKDADGQGYAHCIFDTNTFDVYEIHVEVPGYDQAFRWLNPATEHAFFAESRDREVDANEAWEGVKYVNIDGDNPERILDYLDDIGDTYYDNLPLPADEEIE
jgi:hypothetical protein